MIFFKTKRMVLFELLPFFYILDIENAISRKVLELEARTFIS